jgi:hypothetical protein
MQKESRFKSLFRRRLIQYYMQPRIFQVNMEIRIHEKFIIMNETVIAHSGKQAGERAVAKVREEMNIRSVGHRCLGRPKKFKNSKW